MKIYLAGPMRGYADFNHPAFHRAAALLRADGHHVFSPAEHDVANGYDFTGTDGSERDLANAGFDFRKTLGDDLAWICGEADAVVVMPGWRESSGARAEVTVALTLRIPVWELASALLYGQHAPIVSLGRQS